MRVNLGPYIIECGKENPSQTKLTEYRDRSKQDIKQVKGAAGGLIMDYYWGKSIHQIEWYELNLYQNYVDKCPIEPHVKINDVLRFREDKLMQLMLTKMYDPRKYDRYHDNPYFANF